MFQRKKAGSGQPSTIQAIIHNEIYLGRRIWNKQDYQTKRKKWRDRSEWIITENAHPAIINEELFKLCQQRSEKRHNGGGVTHNPYQIKPASPFWLRGIFTCDKCGSRMVDNSTSTTKKYGGQKYYVCGGYMRKGKEFCPYVSWRKDRIEQIVVNKLRSALLRLTFDNQLEEEIRKYHDEANRHQIVSAAKMEAEINFLEKRIEQIQQELQTGSGKAYYAEMIAEMSSELTEKRREHADHQSANQAFNVSQESLQTFQQDIKTMIGLLDEETPSPQLMNEWVKRFVSNVTVHRETEKFYMTVQLWLDESVLYQKVIVVDLE